MDTDSKPKNNINESGSNDIDPGGRRNILILRKNKDTFSICSFCAFKYII